MSAVVKNDGSCNDDRGRFVECEARWSESQPKAIADHAWKVVDGNNYQFGCMECQFMVSDCWPLVGVTSHNAGLGKDTAF